LTDLERVGAAHDCAFNRPGAHWGSARLCDYARVLVVAQQDARGDHDGI
jgi:hypothetical protein